MEVFRNCVAVCPSAADTGVGSGLRNTAVIFLSNVYGTSKICALAILECGTRFPQSHERESHYWDMLSKLYRELQSVCVFF